MTVLGLIKRLFHAKLGCSLIIPNTVKLLLEFHRNVEHEKPQRWGPLTITLHADKRAESTASIKESPHHENGVGVMNMTCKNQAQ